MGRARGNGRLRVEDCDCFDGVVLNRAGVFTSAFESRWTYKFGRSGDTVSYTVVERPGVAMGLHMEHAVTIGSTTRPYSTRYLIEILVFVSDDGFTPAIVDIASRISSQQAAQATTPQPGGMATATAEKQ